MEHGELGNKNRKFIKGEFPKAKPGEQLFRLSNPIELPKKIDLRDNYKVKVLNQLSTSSCVAHALSTAYAIRSLIKNKTNDPIYLSRLFIYYNARKITNKTNVDQGTFIKHGIQSMTTEGSCLETFWPFNLNKLYTCPPMTSYQEALSHVCTSSYQIDPNDYVNQFKYCISKQIPIICGIQCYSSFSSDETAKTGIVKYPDVKKEMTIGGHAICIIGYDDEKQHFIFQNSYDTVWGENGYGYIGYSYIDNQLLCSDCHIVDDIEIKKKSVTNYQPYPSPYVVNPPYYPYQPYYPYHPFYYYNW